MKKRSLSVSNEDLFEGSFPVTVTAWEKYPSLLSVEECDGNCNDYLSWFGINFLLDNPDTPHDSPDCLITPDPACPKEVLISSTSLT